LLDIKMPPVVPELEQAIAFAELDEIAIDVHGILTGTLACIHP
jgi:hypothetical protein